MLERLRKLATVCFCELVARDGNVKCTTHADLCVRFDAKSRGCVVKGMCRWGVGATGLGQALSP
jgi:hypothetical protein